jgi:hypothetical protein
MDRQGQLLVGQIIAGAAQLAQVDLVDNLVVQLSLEVLPGALALVLNLERGAAGARYAARGSCPAFP